MRKVYLERTVEKYLADLSLNKTICTYIINVALEVPENLVLEAIGWKRCSTMRM